MGNGSITFGRVVYKKRLTITKREVNKRSTTLNKSISCSLLLCRRETSVLNSQRHVFHSPDLHINFRGRF